MQCPKCGKQISNTATFCGYCSAAINNSSEETSDANARKTKSKKKKSLLVFLLIIAALGGIAGYLVGGVVSNNNHQDVSSVSEEKEVANEHFEEKSTGDSEQNVEDNKVQISEKSTEKQEVKAEIKNSAQPEVISKPANRFTATSVYPNEGALTYYPSNAFDGNNQTAWVEGVAGDGIGEVLTVEFAEPVNIQAFGFDNGYIKNEKVYYKNNRPENLKFIFKTENGTDETTFHFTDKYDGDFFFHYANSFKKVAKVDIRIESVYKGNECDDTCITDIFFYDENMKIIDLN